MPKVRVVITRRQCLDVNLRSARREVKVADQIDIPPSDGRRAPENLDRLLVIGCELLLVLPRQEQGIVVDDGVCDEPLALVPDLLLRFGLHAELARIHVRNGPPHAVVVSLASIQRFLNTLAKDRITHKIEDVDRAPNGACATRER